MTDYSFTPSQISTAQQVLATAQQQGANSTELLALMEAGLVESGMENLPYGDKDSQGVFQERPSQGWTNVMNIPDATIQILQHMNTSLTDPGAMAQSAERSAYPSKYDAVQAEAQALLVAAGGATPGAGVGSGSSTATLASTTSSDPITTFTNWLQASALRVGIIIFGAIIMLIGMWLALGHTSKDLPQVVTKMTGGKS